MFATVAKSSRLAAMKISSFYNIKLYILGGGLLVVYMFYKRWRRMWFDRKISSTDSNSCSRCSVTLVINEGHIDAKASFNSIPFSIKISNLNMVTKEKSILDLAIEINNKKTKPYGNDSGDRVLLILGSKSSGKSSLINRLQDKDEIPKATLALDYNFVRRTGKSLFKDVCHIWELGGGLLFSELANTIINCSGNLNRLSIILMLDLSRPQQLWLTLEHFVTKLLQFLSKHMTENGICEEMSKNAWENLGGMDHHQDKSLMEPFPIPLIIIGGKYDLYQIFNPAEKKIICNTLRNVAHAYGATLLYFSTKEQLLVKRAKDILNQYAFGVPSQMKTITQDFLKPLFIPAGKDSFQLIGGAQTSGSFGVAMQRWKHSFTMQFPQNESVAAVPDDPAKDLNFEELAIDKLRAQKNNEIEKYQWELDGKLRLRSIQD